MSLACASVSITQRTKQPINKTETNWALYSPCTEMKLTALTLVCCSSVKPSSVRSLCALLRRNWTHLSVYLCSFVHACTGVTAMTGWRGSVLFVVSVLRSSAGSLAALNDSHDEVSGTRVARRSSDGWPSFFWSASDDVDDDDDVWNAVTNKEN